MDNFIKLREDGMTEEGENPMWAALQKVMSAETAHATRVAALRRMWPGLMRGDGRLPPWDQLNPDVRDLIARYIFPDASTP